MNLKSLLSELGIFSMIGYLLGFYGFGLIILIVMTGEFITEGLSALYLDSYAINHFLDAMARMGIVGAIGGFLVAVAGNFWEWAVEDDQEEEAEEGEDDGGD